MESERIAGPESSASQERLPVGRMPTAFVAGGMIRNSLIIACLRLQFFFFVKLSEKTAVTLSFYELRCDMNTEKIEQGVALILEGIGEDPGREGLQDTPGRVARMYEEICGGLQKDPSELVRAMFNVKYDEMVLLRDISFCSLCEHHLLPFIGKAHVGYIPNGKIIGISKLARIVDYFAGRPQVQERLTNQIADFIVNSLKPKGVIVVLDATHSCMTVRGVKKAGACLRTFRWASSG